MEAPREVRGESEWVMKATDKWGQRKRGCYSVGEQKSRQRGWWEWQTNAGGMVKKNAQPKNSESLSQIFRQSLTENFLLFLFCFCFCFLQ